MRGLENTALYQISTEGKVAISALLAIFSPL
jgi:hypothetical protein